MSLNDPQSQILDIYNCLIPLHVCDTFLRLPHNQIDVKSKEIIESFTRAAKYRDRMMQKVTGNDQISVTDFAVEQCEICNGDIPFENLTSANCEEGHEFGKACTFMW